ncbi:MAG: flagellar protein FlaG [Nitrospirae bacterium]|nr:flagellar protein FlaG [Nitrospirota bacterium]MBF0592827.1 flagellar protein FlaG [Nitrospirota bacterium]
MIEAIASVMPVNLVMKVDVSGGGYDSAQGLSGHGGNGMTGDSVSQDAGQGMKWGDGDNVAIKPVVAPGKNAVNNETVNKVDDLKKFVSKETDNTSAADTQQTKAYFEIDDDGKAVIKVVDSEGKVIKQMPPEDYKKAVRRLEEVYKKLFHKEV